MFSISFQRGIAVVERLLERFGADQLNMVEQLSPHSFRARLANGGIALAVVADSGDITIRETD